jgi:hypothetical protein
MMEAVSTSEMSVHVNVTRRRYIPEDSKLHTRYGENLKSHICFFYSTKYTHCIANFHLMFLLGIVFPRCYTHRQFFCYLFCPVIVNPICFKPAYFASRISLPASFSTRTISVKFILYPPPSKSLLFELQLNCPEVH